jgi:hypothetical protein
VPTEDQATYWRIEFEKADRKWKELEKELEQVKAERDKEAALAEDWFQRCEGPGGLCDQRDAAKAELAGALEVIDLQSNYMDSQSRLIAELRAKIRKLEANSG